MQMGEEEDSFGWRKRRGRRAGAGRAIPLTAAVSGGGVLSPFLGPLTTAFLLLGGILEKSFVPKVCA